jgi:hypothetical protein
MTKYYIFLFVLYENNCTLIDLVNSWEKIKVKILYINTIQIESMELFKPNIKITLT